MRVLIVTAGSRGDLAPFTGLGQRLRQAGHQVALAAHAQFAVLVRGPHPGVPAARLGPRAIAEVAAGPPEVGRSVTATASRWFPTRRLAAAMQVTGYWWPAWPPGVPAAGAAGRLRAAGPRPVFVAFGSMTPSHERLHDDVAVAVHRAGVRAVVQSGWAALGPASDDILVVDDLLA